MRGSGRRLGGERGGKHKKKPVGCEVAVPRESLRDSIGLQGSATS